MDILAVTTRNGIEEVNVRDARRRVKEGALLVDVRERDEWDVGHVAGALHLPLSQIAWKIGDLPRDRELLFICRSGNRSELATIVTRRAGFPSVKNVRGGMLAWQDAGLPVEN